jgi:hypothetical protein
MLMFGRSRLWLAASFALVLAACGGDGGSGNTGSAGAGGGGSGGSTSRGGAGGTTSGSAGSGGSAGSDGSSGGSGGGGGGTGGSGGSAGASGNAGRGGTAGGGAAGTGGAGGAGGAAGNAGGGRGGSGGTAGAAGSAGARGGSGGAGGSAGAGGAAGTGGSAGAPGGGSGGGGTAGAAGSAGARGGSGGGAGAGGAPSFMPCPTNGDACRILPLGDSITDGFNIPGGYRIELFRRAHMAGQNITFTGSLNNGPAMVDGVTFPNRHEGHSGWTIDMIGDQVPSPALQTAPHIVLLMAGTNDAIMNLNIAQAPTRLGTLLDELTTGAPNALILVAQLTPLSDSARESRVTGFNAAIPAIVQTRVAAGKHIKLVDMHTGFPTSELADGIHPNTAGYARMAGVWYAALDPLLP